MDLKFRERHGDWLDRDELEPDTELLTVRAARMHRRDGAELRDLVERYAPPQLVLEQPPVGLVQTVVDGRSFDLVELLDLRGHGIGDELAACRAVQRLTVSGSIFGRDLAHVDGSTAIERLDLTDTQVLWRDLATCSLPSLQWLTLASVPLFDEQDYAAAIDRLDDGPTLERELCARRWPDRVAWRWDLPFRPELDELPSSAEDLEHGPPVLPDPRAWARLARRVVEVPAPTPALPELVYLSLRKCMVPPALIAALTGLAQLRVLDLGYTGVQHDELSPLLDHPTLRKVNLDVGIRREDLDRFVRSGVKPR